MVCVSEVFFLPCKDFIHADHTVEQGAHLLSTALASFSELDLVERRVLSVNFWRRRLVSMGKMFKTVMRS